MAEASNVPDTNEFNVNVNGECLLEPEENSESTSVKITQLEVERLTRLTVSSPARPSTCTFCRQTELAGDCMLEGLLPNEFYYSQNV